MSSLTPLLSDSDKPADRTGFWQRLLRGTCRLRLRDDWDHFAGPGWVERIMDWPVTDRFQAKQGRTVGRLKLQAWSGNEVDRLTVYLKRHYRVSWWQGLISTLFPWLGCSPAVKEWNHLEWARQQGVPVPRVVAAGEFIGPWCRLRSFLAVEELAGMLPLEEAIPLASRQLPPDQFRLWKRSLIRELARLTRLLHDRRAFHKDLYLCHFYVFRGDLNHLPPRWRGRVFLIDLHRLTHHPWTWWWWQIKDLAQLLYSTDIEGIDDRDRLYFWRDYRGPGPCAAPAPGCAGPSCSSGGTIAGTTPAIRNIGPGCGKMSPLPQPLAAWRKRLHR